MRKYDDPRRPPYDLHPHGTPRWGIVLFIMFIFFFITGLLIANYFLDWIYQYTGIPPTPISYLLLSLIGLIFLYIWVRLVGLWWIKFNRHHKGHNRNLISETMVALDRIASGDFNVLIETQRHHPYNLLIQRINKMAQELRSMEHLRQDFISNVSHEIQSPLTSISGFAELLKNDDLQTDQRLHYISIIEAESKRLSKLSENLLKLSMLDADDYPYNPQSFRLNKQIQDILLMLEPQWADKNINLNIELAPLAFPGDEDLLSQVWINLIHNSIKFTPDEGTISVKLSCDDKNVVVTIADNGIGIPPDDLLHIFERFYKADKSRDRSQAGNGLGLSIVKKIIDIHGGVIAVNSQPHQGSCFTVTLPLKA